MHISFCYISIYDDITFIIYSSVVQIHKAFFFVISMIISAFFISSTYFNMLFFSFIFILKWFSFLFYSFFIYFIF